MAPPVVRTKVVTDESRPMDVGSVLWILMPVSPLTPLNVIETELAAGGTIVTAVGTNPVIAGTVMVFAPELRDLTSKVPGEAAFAAAARNSWEVTSPVYPRLIDLVDDTAIYEVFRINAAIFYAQKSPTTSSSLIFGSRSSLRIRWIEACIS